ncbi:hypothetical protein KJ836_00630 [Patescibacteria group bacterium]|nr:hypothetical protein [Patescibacteria group bacterium]
MPDDIDSNADHSKLGEKLIRLITELQEEVLFLADEHRVMQDLVDSATRERDEAIELANTSEKEKLVVQAKFDTTNNELNDARRTRDNFRTDVNTLRERISELELQISSSGETLQTALQQIKELMQLIGIDQDDTVVETNDAVKILATGLFVCRAGDQYDSFCPRVFKRLKQQMPQIDFGEEPVFIRSDMGHNRPSFPRQDVDVVVVLAAGFSHGDVAKIQKCFSDPHVITGSNHLSHIVLNLKSWLDRRATCPV